MLWDFCQWANNVCVRWSVLGCFSFQSFIYLSICTNNSWLDVFCKSHKTYERLILLCAVLSYENAESSKIINAEELKQSSIFPLKANIFLLPLRKEHVYYYTGKIFEPCEINVKTCLKKCEMHGKNIWPPLFCTHFSYEFETFWW